MTRTVTSFLPTRLNYLLIRQIMDAIDYFVLLLHTLIYLLIILPRKHLKLKTSFLFLFRHNNHLIIRHNYTYAILPVNNSYNIGYFSTILPVNISHNICYISQLSSNLIMPIILPIIFIITNINFIQYRTKNLAIPFFQLFHYTPRKFMADCIGLDH